MKLDEEHLADTPVFAELVREKAIGMAGALELLSDDYEPPKPLILSVTPKGEVDDDTQSMDVEEVDPEEVDTSECNPSDEDGYPDMVAVKRVPTSPRGVKLVRPRSLADMPQDSSS